MEGLEQAVGYVDEDGLAGGGHVDLLGACRQAGRQAGAGAGCNEQAGALAGLSREGRTEGGGASTAQGHETDARSVDTHWPPPFAAAFAVIKLAASWLAADRSWLAAQAWPVLLGGTATTEFVDSVDNAPLDKSRAQISSWLPLPLCSCPSAPAFSALLHVPSQELPGPLCALIFLAPLSNMPPSLC